MLHTDNKKQIRKLIPSPSKRRVDFTIGQTWSGPIKLGPTCSTFICFKMWDIRSCSRLQYLTLTFTRYYSLYRGTRDSNKILYYLNTYFTQGSGFKKLCNVLHCTELYCTVTYCTVLYTLLYSNAPKLLLSRSIYVAIHSNNVFLRFITVNYLELRTRGEQRRMWRQVIKFADTHTCNQVKSNSKAEATLSTVVCGYYGRGPRIAHNIL